MPKSNKALIRILQDLTLANLAKGRAHAKSNSAVIEAYLSVAKSAKTAKVAANRARDKLVAAKSKAKSARVEANKAKKEYDRAAGEAAKTADAVQAAKAAQAAAFRAV